MTHRSGGRIVVTHLRASAGSGGGPEKTIFNTASHIDQSRFAYDVVYLCKQGEKLAGIRALADAHGARLTIIPGRSIFDLKQIAGLGRHLRATGTQILHGHDPKSDCYTRLCGFLFPKIRRVTTLHGFVVTPESRKSAMYASLDQRLLSSFHSVIAVSEPLMRLAENKGAHNAALLHNAVDVRTWNRETALQGYFPELNFAKPFVVGFVGRLSPEKGVLDFLEIARRVHTLEPDVYFVVAGEGALLEEAKHRAIALGLAGHIRFLGQCSPEKIAYLYAHLGCLLSPSHTEGMPNTLLEAMALETAIIATDVGGVSELVEHERTGLLFPPMDLDGLAQGVLRLVRDPEYSRRLAQQASRRVATEFSFSERTKKLMGLYKRLVSETPGQGHDHGRS